MIRVGIVGYGNLGKGVECAVKHAPDMELVGVFTRRDPASVKIRTEGAGVYSDSEAESFKDRIDVMILCGGSATDLPEQTPAYAAYFNVVDAFDNHHHIPEHFERVNQAALQGKTVSVISSGWDPGMFSLNRIMAEALLPEGSTYTFWGKGVSQGHSDAVRRIQGVKDARQYTIPVEEALEAVRSGSCPDLTTRQKHRRQVFVVAEEGADRAAITEKIVTMPDYFDEYDTEVNFISADQMAADHQGLPHGGFVIRSGRTGWDNENTAIVEYSLQLDSNPEFTACALVATARAAVRMSAEGQSGCRSLFDIPPAYYYPEDGAYQRRKLL